MKLFIQLINFVFVIRSAFSYSTDQNYVNDWDWQTSLFEHTNFEGGRLNIWSKSYMCVNIDNQKMYTYPDGRAIDANDEVSSVNSFGNCIKLYSDKDCSGDTVEISPETGKCSHNNLNTCDFNDKTSSVSSCSYANDCEQNSDQIEIKGLWPNAPNGGDNEYYFFVEAFRAIDQSYNTNILSAYLDLVGSGKPFIDWGLLRQLKAGGYYSAISRTMKLLNDRVYGNSQIPCDLLRSILRRAEGVIAYRDFDIKRREKQAKDQGKCVDSKKKEDHINTLNKWKYYSGFENFKKDVNFNCPDLDKPGRISRPQYGVPVGKIG